MSTEKEISLKEFLGKLGSWFKYLLSNWILICIVSVATAGLGVWYAYAAKPKYEATVSFVLSSNNMPGGSLFGLASQFGINLDGSNTDVFAGDNIIALMKSRRMVQQALLKKPKEINASLINIIAEEMKFDKVWAKKDRTKSAFPFPDDAAKITKVQDSLLRAVYIFISKKMLDISKPDKDQSIYVVATNSSNEIFSYYLAKYLV